MTSPRFPDGPILEVGIDLIRIADVEDAIRDFGDSYLERVFTDAERAYCAGLGGQSSGHFAARFAAKEATAKVLRVGDQAMSWRCIEVVRRPDGSCAIVLHGAAVAIAQQNGIRNLSLSLSHDGDYATAVVVGDRHRPRTLVTRFRRKAPAGSYGK